MFIKVYVYREGLIRFCSQKYNLTRKNCKDKFSHLTNFSLNKFNPEYRSACKELEGGVAGVA
jgi:Tubulin-tyrosine ligase family